MKNNSYYFIYSIWKLLKSCRKSKEKIQIYHIMPELCEIWQCQNLDSLLQEHIKFNLFTTLVNIFVLYVFNSI